MDYVITIPSYNRFSTILGRTLKFLLSHNIDMNKVYIFAHPFSYDEYKVIEEKIEGVKVIESKGGIMNSRNYITEYFDEKTNIVSIDDDVDELIDLNTNQPIHDLDGFIKESFNMCGNGIFGVCALTNKFYSNMKDKFGLQSIVATFCGFVNYKSIVLTLDLMEDYEKVIKYYQSNKTILKRSWVGIKTKYWTNKGGIQTELDCLKRIQLQNYCANELKSRYPDYVFHRKRKNGLIDIRFRRNLK
jgi:hypothetical protein